MSHDDGFLFLVASFFLRFFLCTIITFSNEHAPHTMAMADLVRWLSRIESIFTHARTHTYRWQNCYFRISSHFYFIFFANWNNIFFLFHVCSVRFGSVDRWYSCCFSLSLLEPNNDIINKLKNSVLFGCRLLLKVKLMVVLLLRLLMHAESSRLSRIFLW